MKKRTISTAVIILFVATVTGLAICDAQSSKTANAQWNSRTWTNLSSFKTKDCTVTRHIDHYDNKTILIYTTSTGSISAVVVK